MPEARGPCAALRAERGDFALRRQNDGENSATRTGPATLKEPESAMRRPNPFTFALVPLCAALSVGCAEDPIAPQTPRPPLVVRQKPAPGPAPAEWSYWERIEPALRDDPQKVTALPLLGPQVTHPLGAEKRWAKLSAAQREAFLKDGFVALESKSVVDDEGDSPSLAEAYEQAERDKMPAVVTIDTLLFVAQAAVDRAVADLEVAAFRPALLRLLASLSSALTVEERSVPLDLADGLRLARGFVAVAQRLVSPDAAIAPDISPGVGEELRRIEAHTGIERSPLFGVMVDYGAFAPTFALRPNDDAAKPRLRLAQAMTWLAQAPFMLASRGDTAGATLSVQTARVHARAALLLGRLLTPASSAERAADYTTLRRGLTFLSGAADDPSPVDAAQTAASVGVALDTPQAIANVAKLDHVRRAMLQRFQPGTYDGVAEVKIPEASSGPQAGGVGRAAHGVRFLGPAAPADALALQSLTFPYVGHATGEAHGLTAQAGHRAFATAIDVAAWLGSAEADKIRHESGDDAYEGFREAKERAQKNRPAELAPERHASLHMSSLDVLVTYLSPSRGEVAVPASFSASYARRKVEVATVAWAHERHDARTFGGPPPYAPLQPKPRPKLEVHEAPVFVEPHPEALGRLLSYMKQAKNGLTALGLPKGSRGELALVEVTALVTAAYDTATRATNGEPARTDDAARLSTLADTLEWLDHETGMRIGGVMAAHVHQDAVSGRVSVAGVSGLTEIHMAVRDPRTGDLVHAVGARLVGLDGVWPRSRPTHDGALKEDFGKSPQPPPTWTRSYTVR